MTSEAEKKRKIEGTVVDKEERRYSRIGSSNHISIPSFWKKIFNPLLMDVLELELIKEDSGGWCILITKPKREKEPENGEV